MSSLRVTNIRGGLAFLQEEVTVTARSISGAMFGPLLDFISAAADWICCVTSHRYSRFPEEEAR